MSLVKSPTAILELVAEDKICNLLTEDNVPKRLEASGVVFLNGYYYVIFDNLRQNAKIKKDLKDIRENSLFSLAKTKNKDGFEDITYDHSQQKFYLVIEALKQKKDIYKAQIEEYDRNFNFLGSNWVDFKFDGVNKGFEGLEHVKKNGQEYLLALCEGNKCQGGKKGRKPGGGRIKVLQKQEKYWEKVKTIKLPKSVEFEDYSAISQASAQLWIGIFQDDDWEFVDEGVIYEFPTNEKEKVIYCNVEGVCWLKPNQIVVVSDKYKTSEQPTRCQQKDQSIHIFNIP